MIIHLSKPIESITPRVNPNVNYGFGVTVMCQCRLGSSVVTYVSLWCRMSRVGRLYCRDKGYMGTIFTLYLILL